MTSDEVYADLMLKGTLSNPRPWMLSTAVDMAEGFLGHWRRRITGGFADASWTCLDLGCGVGKFTKILTANEFDCVGMDINPTFIAKAGEMCPKTVYMQADILKDVDAAGAPYGVVSMTHNVFNSIRDWKKLLEIAIGRVSQGGFLVFDFITLRGFETWQDVQIQDRPDFFMLQKCVYDPKNRSGVVRLTGFVERPATVWGRFDVQSDAYYHNYVEVDHYLRARGFEVRCYPDWVRMDDMRAYNVAGWRKSNNVTPADIEMQTGLHFLCQKL